MLQRLDSGLQILRDDGELLLYRGRLERDGIPVLVVTPAAEHPSLGCLDRLTHEYALREELDGGWAVRPLALLNDRGRTKLVLEDPGAVTLDSLLNGGALDLSRWLTLAIGLAASLGQVHGRGLIHKDVKPQNLLVDAEDKIRFTGFGIASRLPAERQTADAPDLLAGTLAYMAPEQTGRMNCSTDSRSDLYALGVTLYQMLAGRLPFTAMDAMGWLHCHLARQPAAFGGDVPPAIAAIIFKLLAKSPQQRYQTARGLEADLCRCREQWRSQGRIDLFPLGADDIPDQLLVPEILYGRRTEIDVLLASFKRVVEDGTPGLVLISGVAGIGKSAVVTELHQELVPLRGLFVAGKFDEYQRNIPYATLAQALKTLIRQVLGKSEAEFGNWKNALLDAVGPNGQILINLVPELELVIGPQAEVPSLPPYEALNRFRWTFGRFLNVFAQPDHPLVLFLDDLQWVDAATVDLLEHLITVSDIRYLFLVGAYRDNEVDPAHPLARSLRAIRQSNARVLEIFLGPLAQPDVVMLVCDTLHCAPKKAKSLAKLVCDKTGGNPFFAIQFLKALAEEGLLSMDRASHAWCWDVARIRAKDFTDNVVDLMVGKLSRLPDRAREILKLFACLGNSVETTVLAAVCGESAERVDADLWEAVRAGLIFRLNNTYKFLHDRVQEAAYSLIPEDDRPAVHLHLGRLLLTLTDPADLGGKVFEIAGQINHGARLIDMPDERERMAELNLMAGQRAMTAAAYASGLNYLSAGMDFLAPDSWDRRYDLSFALEFGRAECEFHTGALDIVQDRLDRLGARARDMADLAAVTCVQAELHMMRQRADTAVDLCLGYLAKLGITWSAHPSEQDVQEEFDRIRDHLGGRSVEQLVDEPFMWDPRYRGAMDVLIKVLPPALFTDANLLALCVGRIANISLEHGNTDGSCVGYNWLAEYLGDRGDDWNTAYSFAKLALALIEKRGLDRYKARVYQTFGYAVLPWAGHVRNSYGVLRESFLLAQQVGDVAFAAYAPATITMLKLLAGESLAVVEEEGEAGLVFAQKANVSLVVDFFTFMLPFIRNLRGFSTHFGFLDDNEFQEARFERHVESGPSITAYWYWTRVMQARFHADDYKAAIAAASKMRQLLWTNAAKFERTEYYFYDALSRAACYEDSSAEERAEHRQIILAHHAQLDKWAKRRRENFGSRAALVAAEWARLDGRWVDAMRLYEDAISEANKHGFVQIEALAHELAARAYAGLGLHTVAEPHLRSSVYCYNRWGAIGKVRQIFRLHPNLAEEPALVPPNATIGTPVRQLDVTTIVKASQALSGEIILENLIETLMKITVEHAGAERGLLVLLRDGEMTVEAEAASGQDGIAVTQHRGLASTANLPESLLRYVVRTRETVILDDASSINTFPSDISLRHARSVLCLPLTNQAKLVGLLYLENNAAPATFTPDRIAMLEVLASQASISLENARLYADLREENTERKRVQEHQKVLLDELNHRVKNTLLVVMAIVRQTASTATSPEALKEALDARLVALSQTHNLLTESAWRGAGLREVLNLELAPHCAGDSNRLVVNGNDVLLGPKGAVMLGLVFHELATNAAKYGALSVPDGCVLVSWTSDETSPERPLRLEWRESGGPLVQPPSRKGFGLRFIERGVGREFAGKVSAEFPPEGVHYIMEVSLARLSVS